MKNTLTVFLKYQYLLENLISRDFKVKYRRSVLGILWSVLNPLFMMLITTAVFSTIFKSNIQNFPVYMLTGQLMFIYFTDATNSAMQAVLGSAPLIKKVYIPKYIFPLEKVLFALVNSLFSMVALIIVMLITGAPFQWTMLLMPVPLLLLTVFNVGLGLILSSLAVFFRDIIHLYGILTQALFYLTPIFYPVDIVPHPISAFLKLNPIYWYVTMFRDLVYYGQMPTAAAWAATLGFAVFFLAAGLFTFKMNQDKFILYM